MSVTEIPVTRLGVTFVIPLEDPEALNFLHKAVVLAMVHGNGRFDFKLTSLTDCASPPPVKPTEDWGRLISGGLPIKTPHPVLLAFNLEAVRARLSVMAEASRDAAPKAADPEPYEYHGPIPPSQAQLPTEPASRVDGGMRLVGEQGPELEVTGPSDRTPPPPATLPAPAFSPRPATLGERLIAYLRDLKSKGQPMPGNRDIADFLGVSAKQFTVLLTGLRAKEAVDYEWRPAPTPEDQTLQRRFVTKA